MSIPSNARALFMPHPLWKSKLTHYHSFGGLAQCRYSALLLPLVGRGYEDLSAVRCRLMAIRHQQNVTACGYSSDCTATVQIRFSGNAALKDSSSSS